jgi:hypothetical protein
MMLAGQSLDAFPMTQVAQWFAKGEMVPFLGSGASFAGVTGEPHLPSGAALAAELIVNLDPYPGTDHDPLAKVAQYYTKRLDRGALYEMLHDRLYVQQVEAAVSPTAQFLAELPPGRQRLLILTTNYDTQVERAFAAAGRELLVVTQHVRNPEHASLLLVQNPDGRLDEEDAREYTLPEALPLDTPILYKMHGSAHWAAADGRDTLVVTEDDYADFLTNSSPTQFPPNAFTRMIKHRRFLFLGYSLEDWNFRVMLRTLAARHALTDSGGRRHFSVQYEPPPIDVALWEQRQVTIFDADLAEFIERLRGEMGRAAP